MTTTQWNAGDPLGNPGGLYRGPTSMIKLIHYKRCACGRVNHVQCSIIIITGGVPARVYEWK